MDHEEYRVKLDLFEGPLDLLLFLIRKNELDIYDIPIAAVTEQYLEYLNLMKSLNINLASDFLSMAATLVHIKSRMLLPSSSLDQEDEEDPRMEIVRPLVEYMQIKEAARLLGERDILNRDVFVRDFVAEELKGQEEQGELLSVSLFDLLTAFKELMEESLASTKVRVPAEQMSVQDKMDQLLARLRECRSLSFRELFKHPLDREDLIVTFLALLELVRLGLVKVFQFGENGAIRVFFQDAPGQGSRVA